jgi:thiol-disulfide isomerase/thioredoxin
MRTSLVVLGTLTSLAIAGCDTAEPNTTTPRTTESPAAEAPAATSTTPPMIGNPLPLTNLDGWLQTEVTSLDDLRGKVVIVQFWTFGCRNCKNTLPYLQDIYAEYKDSGLEIVGVHSPEFAYEEDPEAIQAAAEELGVTWPIALDTRQRSFFSWQGSRGYWPRTYVLDRDGLIRFDHIGEGKYEELEQTVEALLAE